MWACLEIEWTACSTFSYCTFSSPFLSSISTWWTQSNNIFLDFVLTNAQIRFFLGSGLVKLNSRIAKCQCNNLINITCDQYLKYIHVCMQVGSRINKLPTSVDDVYKNVEPKQIHKAWVRRFAACPYITPERNLVMWVESNVVPSV